MNNLLTESESNQDSQGVASRYDLSTLILAGLIVGVGCGIFFGEHCASLSILGDAFVGLLRMTVLPYIAVTLIANLGRLTLAQARRLFWIGGLTMIFLWCLALLAVFLLATMFPNWNAGSFFSTNLLNQPQSSDLLSHFVPSNIFSALAENHVPAIVVFCICAGIALSRMEDRQTLISQLDIISGVLLSVSKFITKLAPLGVFAIAASIAGTATLSEVLRLQTYLIAYSAGAIFMAFIALPCLVTAITPLTYREVFRIAKEPMLTAFATGKLIVVLPMLIENTERLFRQRQQSSNGDDIAPTIDVLYATAYPFPHVGKLLSMLFIPFAAWFTGSSMQWYEFPSFLATGVFSYFGGPIVAIPYLLDQTHLPHDMFQLFLLSGVYGERIGDALGAMHLAVFTILSTFGFRRMIELRSARLIQYFVVTGVTAAVMLGCLCIVLSRSVGMTEDRSDVLTQMQLIEQPIESSVFPAPTANPVPMLRGETLLERIRRRGILRVGYNEDKIPFAFFNDRGDLVGYDINMAHALARDLNVTLELVRFDRSTISDQLQADHFDLVMSGLVGTLERSEQMRHTSSYMDVHLALVVPDYRSREFKSLSMVRNATDLKIGFVDLSRGFVERIRHALPEANLIEIRNCRDYFNGKETGLDALLVSAEAGSAFTLIYPQFEVVVPRDLRVKLPLFYVIGGQDQDTQDFLEHWIALRQKDGTASEYYDHWILGKSRSEATPRWSVLHNVLGW